jgi:ribosome maturation factor RimP
LNLDLSTWLDAQEEAGAADVPADEFELQVGTPGAPEDLTRDFEFEVFKGFEVIVTTSSPHKGKTQFEGALHSRDAKSVVINKTGRLQKIPRELVESVRLPKAKDGDRL